MFFHTVFASKLPVIDNKQEWIILSGCFFGFCIHTDNVVFVIYYQLRVIFWCKKLRIWKKHSLIFVWAAYIYYSFVISNDLIIFILSLFPTKTKRGYFANYNAMSHCSVSKISERVISPLASMSHTFDTFFAGVLSQ